MVVNIFFMYLLTICIFSLEKCLFMFSAGGTFECCHHQVWSSEDYQSIKKSLFSIILFMFKINKKTVVLFMLVTSYLLERLLNSAQMISKMLYYCNKWSIYASCVHASISVNYFKLTILALWLLEYIFFQVNLMF